MPNYIVNECLTNDEYIFTGVSHTVGQTIRFVFNEQSYCGTVGEVTSSPPSADFGQLYDDCCACLSGITESVNFKFIICNTLAEINIEATNFCSEYGVPTTGLTYEIQFDSYVPFCATFSGLTESGETNYHYSSGPFLDCELCTEPIESGVDYTTCSQCVVSGETIMTTVSQPHAIYTNEFGKAVVQMNSVVLGGVNGLNN